MKPPVFWLIAGPNGAGKTTFMQRTEFVPRLLLDVTLLNPDNVVLLMLRRKGFAGFHDAPQELLREFNINAANLVMDSLLQRLRRGDNVAVETVLSSPKYQTVVDEVVSLGGEFHLLYVALNSWKLSAERIRNRVNEGGHDVPTEKLESRWRRSIELLPWFAARATTFSVVDNSDSTEGVPPVLLADGGAGQMTIHMPDTIPEITAALRRELGTKGDGAK